MASKRIFYILFFCAVFYITTNVMMFTKKWKDQKLPENGYFFFLLFSLLLCKRVSLREENSQDNSLS